MVFGKIQEEINIGSLKSHINFMNGGAALRRYVAKWLKQNAGCILKSKKYVKILGSKHCRYIYHDIQTVPKGDRMHFCTIYKIYAEDKKIKFDYLVGKG